MKASLGWIMRLLTTLAVCSVIVLAGAGRAAADDAGSDPSFDGGASGQANESGTAGGSSRLGAGGAPLACNGALCDTTNGSTCTLARGAVGSVPLRWTPFAAALAVLGLVAARRIRRRRPLWHARSTETERYL